MTQAVSRTLQQIKRETEQTRAGLTDTVEQLRTTVAETANDIRQRMRPDAIKAEVSNYIKSRGEQLVNDVTAAARRNPMQAVAVGASVAYPLLRMARAIPLPVLMVGAGLFFAGSKTGQSATQKASDIAADLSDEAMRRAHQFGESVSAATKYASEQIDRVSSAVSDGADQVARAAGAMGASIASQSHQLQHQAASLNDKAASLGATFSDRATDLRDQGVRLASSAAATVQDIASGATSVARNAAGNATAAARDAIGNTAEASLDAARTARDKASDLTDRIGKTMFQTIEQNPLLVAGVGLLVGALIASALPRSDIEDGLVGDASTSVKRRAQTAAAQGIDAASNAMNEVYEETTRQAEAEGLAHEGLAKTAQDIGQRVRRVAENAVTTAFEPNRDNRQANNQRSSAHGDTDNG